jgi:hypothetical protein
MAAWMRARMIYQKIKIVCGRYATGWPIDRPYPPPPPPKICGHCGQSTATRVPPLARYCMHIHHCINCSLWTMWTISFHMVHNVHNAPGQNARRQGVDNVDHLDRQFKSLDPFCLFFRQLFSVNIKVNSPHCPQTAQSRINRGVARGPRARFFAVHNQSTTSTNRKL